MTVLLGYQKLMDDWEDDHNYMRRGAAALLKSDYQKLREQYPRQTGAVEENIRLLRYESESELFCRRQFFLKEVSVIICVGEMKMQQMKN